MPETRAKRFQSDDGDAKTDKSFIYAVFHNWEIRDVAGDEPGRTARLERLVREGFLEPWYAVTPKGKKFADIGEDE